jgi:Carbohydrate esterase, sialic acid-specific acetylesterase
LSGHDSPLLPEQPNGKRNWRVIFSLAVALGFCSVPALCFAEDEVGVLRVGPLAFDLWGRLKAYPSYAKKGCPERENVGAVIFLVGQSNAANFAVVESTSTPAASPTRANLSFFQHGDCYISSQIAPALGGTGLGQHFWNWLEFPAQSDYAAKPTILSVFSVHGTKLSEFLDSSALLPTMLREFGALNRRYPVTDIFLLQGESDFLEKTQPELYFQQLQTLIEHFRVRGFTGRFWLNVATRCRSTLRPWFVDNEIAMIQKQATTRFSAGANVRFGIDIDNSLPESMRADGCHFNEKGVRALGKLVGETLAKAR